MKFNITEHCAKRYKERILGNCNTSINLFKTILNDLNTGKNISSRLSEILPRFILYLKERYGSDKGYNIIQKGHTFFILSKRKNTADLYDVVTCYVEFDTFRKFSNTALTNDEIYLKLRLLHK